MINVSTTARRVTPMATFLMATLAVSACTQKDSSAAREGEPTDPALAFLKTGSPTQGLAAAVAATDLTTPAAVAAMPARIRELAKADKEPRATGVMLRALARANKDEGAKVGCDALASVPPITPYGADAHRALMDAALLAIAHGGGTCKDAVTPRLGADRCLPTFRCTADGKRMAPGATTDQTERLCTGQDLAPEVEAELARPKADLLAEKDASYTERFALAALRTMNAVPEKFERAHTRRQYALTQVGTPECGMGVPLKTPCHCMEAAIRDQVCRSDDSPVVFSFCGFEFDDAKKAILNVAEASPP